MDSENSEFEFHFLDHDGNRRVPQKIRADHGPYGYALHPKGQGNNPKAAVYTEDLRELVQGVILQGLGVRAKSKKGKQKGQLNTLYLGEDTIASYYLSKRLHHWVEGAEVRPNNETVPA